MNLQGYYCFEQLPEELKIVNKIKVGAKTPRYDCTFSLGQYLPLEGLKTKKGILYLYLLSSRKRNTTTPEMYLQCNNINLSGLFHYYVDNRLSGFCSGYPSSQKFLTGNKANPFWGVREDGFLFIVSKDLNKIEMFIIQDGRSMIDVYLSQLANGFLDEKIEYLRTHAKVFYHY